MPGARAGGSACESEGYTGAGVVPLSWIYSVIVCKWCAVSAGPRSTRADVM